MNDIGKRIYKIVDSSCNNMLLSFVTLFYKFIEKKFCRQELVVFIQIIQFILLILFKTVKVIMGYKPKAKSLL